jgi:hypothetical protein
LHFKILPEDYYYAIKASYGFWNDSLYLNYYEISRQTKGNLEKRDSIIAGTMRHELTHYRTDKLMERLGLKSKLDDEKSRAMLEIYGGMLSYGGEELSMKQAMLPGYLDMNRKEITEIILDKMVHEGIATYYENLGTEPRITYNIHSIDVIKSINSYYKVIYDMGWNLMYPIISRYGDKGIEHVLLNMPTDFSDLKLYQQRILKDLEIKN